MVPNEEVLLFGLCTLSLICLLIWNWMTPSPLVTVGLTHFPLFCYMYNFWHLFFSLVLMDNFVQEYYQPLQNMLIKPTSKSFWDQDAYTKSCLILNRFYFDFIQLLNSFFHRPSLYISIYILSILHDRRWWSIMWISSSNKYLIWIGLVLCVDNTSIGSFVSPNLWTREILIFHIYQIIIKPNNFDV